MIRDVLEKVRNLPGPFKDMRNMALDIAVETTAKVLEAFPPQLDVLGLVAKVRDELKPIETGCGSEYGTEGYGADTWSSGTDTAEPEPAWNPPPAEPEPAWNPPPAGSEAPVVTAVPSIQDADEAALFDKAFKNPEFKDTQEFKVLAILWKAAKANQGSLSAKDISAYGEAIRIRIRPENVRKVIRTKISEYCTSKEEMADGKRMQVFALNGKGMKHFKEIYLKSQ